MKNSQLNMHGQLSRTGASPSATAPSSTMNGRTPLHLSRWHLVSLFLLGSVLGLVVSIGILVLLAKWHEEVSESWLMTIDQSIQESLHHLASPALTTAMFGLTSLGNILGLLVGAVLFTVGLSLWKRWYEALSLLVAIGGAAALNQVAKFGFHRPRPTVAWALVHEDGYSFPSGHAMMSLIFYGMMAYLLFRLFRRFPRVSIGGALLCLLLVGGIGVSRVYLGAHYPSDVLAGFLASGIWLLAVIGVTEGTRWTARFFRISSATTPGADRFQQR